MLQFSQHQHINTESQMAKSMRGYKMPKNGEFIMREGWYWPDKPCAQGHESPRNKFKQCVQCVREYRKEKGHFTNTNRAQKWRKANKSQLAKKRREYNKNNPAKRMLAAAKKTAKNKGLPFNLAESDIIINYVCPVLGIDLSPSIGERNDSSMSLDRIIPEKGYVKGNVIVISWRANRIKADATASELTAVANFYSNIATKD